jgi:hypothetical protein
MTRLTPAECSAGDVDPDLCPLRDGDRSLWLRYVRPVFPVDGQNHNVKCRTCARKLWR